MTDQEAASWAQRFWELAGRSASFPRSLEFEVAWALPLAIVKLPQLSLKRVEEWASQKSLCIQSLGVNRRLRACLLARAGRGIILLEGTDPENERRVSLAHEVAHFLLDYLDRREKAVAALGETARALLDGDREPTAEERLTGVLRGISVGTYTHLMGRSGSGDVDSVDILRVEDRADRLALELLAPKSTVLARLRRRGVQSRDTDANRIVTETLIGEFGLPERTADSYALFLMHTLRAKRSFREWLGA